MYDVPCASLMPSGNLSLCLHIQHLSIYTHIYWRLGGGTQPENRFRLRLRCVRACVRNRADWLGNSEFVFRLFESCSLQDAQLSSRSVPASYLPEGPTHHDLPHHPHHPSDHNLHNPHHRHHNHNHPLYLHSHQSPSYSYSPSCLIHPPCINPLTIVQPRGLGLAKATHNDTHVHYACLSTRV